jgi:DNA segregation ATPase FtsK/SpoIIIE, S-DNA-T family
VPNEPDPAVEAPQAFKPPPAPATPIYRAWDAPEFRAWIERHAEADSVDSAEIKAWLKDTVPRLRRALRSYDMTAELLDGDDAVRLTPNAALVRFKGGDRLTVKLVDQKLLELQTSHGLKVIDVHPGIGEVVVFVERPRRAVLGLPRLWQQRDPPPGPDVPNASLLIGERERDGQLFYQHRWRLCASARAPPAYPDRRHDRQRQIGAGAEPAAGDLRHQRILAGAHPPHRS